MPSSTYKTFLMYKGTGQGATWQKLIDIKDTPDGIISQKEKIDVTSLSDGERIFVDGIGEGASDGMPFTCNYDLTDIQTIEGLKDQELDLAIWFGGTDPATVGGKAEPTGDLGKFGGKGTVDYYLPGAGVNEARDMIVNITKTSAWARITD